MQKTNVNTRSSNHIPYFLVGSGSTEPPNYAESNALATAAEFRIGKEELIEVKPQNLWGVGYCSILLAEPTARQTDYWPASDDADSLLLSEKDQIKALLYWLNPGGISAVATLLGVSRPTIYKWLDGEHGIKDENQQRLEQLNKVVDYWKEHLTEPMPHGAIRRRLPSGTTLFDLLRQPELDMDAVKKAVSLLAKSYQRSLDSINRLDAAINAKNSAKS